MECMINSIEAWPHVSSRNTEAVSELCLCLLLCLLGNNASGLRLALLLGGGLSKSSKLKVLAVADAAVGWLL
jgi:hypothetical protein